MAHIVALSGYNITIVAETIMLFFSFLPQYLAISGGSNRRYFVCHNDRSLMHGVARASIMVLLALTSRATGGLYCFLGAVFGGIFMVWQNPKILRFDTSFQLSFLVLWV